MEKKELCITIPDECIVRKIYVIRNKRVMLDVDLAELYNVPTGRLNEQVKRNIDRFPTDFMFRLSEEEIFVLRSQFAISKQGRGGRRYLPYVFTEQGVAMLSSVLNSEKAIAVNIQIMRSFIKLRELLLTNEQLRNKIEELEKKYDRQFQGVFDVIHRLLKQEEEEDKKEIGFSDR